jgi:hypothetical protein
MKSIKKLATEIKNHGYLMRQIKRTEKSAIYSKCGGYEVVVIQRHDGYEIKGNWVEPAEYLPKDEDFGTKGWYFGGPDALQHAEKKFAEIEKEACGSEVNA